MDELKKVTKSEHEQIYYTLMKMDSFLQSSSQNTRQLTEIISKFDEHVSEFNKKSSEQTTRMLILTFMIAILTIMMIVGL